MSDETFGTSDITADPTPKDADTGPPPEVAGVDVLLAEPEAENEDGSAKSPPMLKVRQREFPLRADLPGIQVAKIGRAQAQAQKALKGTKNLSEEAKQAAMASAGVAAVTAVADALVSMIQEDSREDFEEYLSDAEPSIGSDELNSFLRDAMEAMTGRPTGPPSP